jgi:hypothetical protein
LKLIDRGRHEWDGKGPKIFPWSYVEITDDLTQNPQPDGSYYLNGEGERIVEALEIEPVILFQPDGAQVYHTHEWNGIGFPT